MRQIVTGVGNGGGEAVMAQLKGQLIDAFNSSKFENYLAIADQSGAFAGVSLDTAATVNT